MSLKQRLLDLIDTNGPVPVSLYMQMCLHDPADGYYATRPGLGRDFITAPEISQVFGELLGLWSAHEWTAMGSPARAHLVELGPGRGTLMSDALRAIRNTPFAPAFDLHLIEPSPPLRTFQAERLAGASPRHHDSLLDVPVGHTLILANEYLDCLPVRQFAKTETGWHERVVGKGPDGALAFGVTADRTPDHPASENSAAEVQPGLELLVQHLSQRREHGDVFRALFIDYGTFDGPPNDTLRAFRAGEQVHPLTAPGKCDLTADVDFKRLRALADAAGLAVHGAVTQSAFLLQLGIEARMQSLIDAEPERGEDIYDSVRRLVDPQEMGDRFKVICLSSPDLPPPAGMNI